MPRLVWQNFEQQRGSRLKREQTLKSSALFQKTTATYNALTR